MTVEIRKPGVVVDARRPLTERASIYTLQVRARAVAVTRRQAWTVWQLLRQMPATVGLLIRWSPRGLGRATAVWARYLRDYDTEQLRSHHTGERQTPELVQIERIRSAHLRARWMVNGTLLLLVLAVVLAWTSPTGFGVLLAVLVLWWTIKIIPGRDMWEYAVAVGLAVATYFAAPLLASYVPRPPAWAWWVSGSLAVLGLGWFGRPRERQLVNLPETLRGGRVPTLTAPMVTAALCALGNSKMKEPDDIRLLTDPHRRGPGIQIDLELPPGVPATWVMERREEFAAALRRELGTVWPSVGRRHPGHLALYVADQPMNEARQAPWPLLKDGTVDLFQPVPLVTDQMGRWVEVTIAYSNGVIGAVPRQGKTFFLREILLVAGLDPRARVYAIDGKGTGDLSPCAHFAHYLGLGDEPEDIHEQLEAMRQLRTELRRRARVIRNLPREEAPESKVTSTLADRRDLRLEPIVVGVDETQVWFQYGEKGNKEHKAIRDEFAAIVTDLVKRGPALGIWVFLATQQVNADTIPTSISNNAVIRFCLKVFGQVANDQILGTGARKDGVDATMFSTEDKGIGYLRADGADALIGRTVYGLDAVASEEVAKRARAIRAAARRLSGQAVGDEPVAPPVDIAADVEQALADRGRASAHLVELVEWLPEMRADYEGLDVDELGKRLRNRGVDVRPVKVAGRTTSGVRAVDLRKPPEPESRDLDNLEGL